jgi:hypothetical protein
VAVVTITETGTQVQYVCDAGITVSRPMFNALLQEARAEMDPADGGRVYQLDIGGTSGLITKGNRSTDLAQRVRACFTRFGIGTA